MGLVPFPPLFLLNFARISGLMLNQLIQDVLLKNSKRICKTRHFLACPRKCVGSNYHPLCHLLEGAVTVSFIVHMSCVQMPPPTHPQDMETSCHEEGRRGGSTRNVPS